MTSLDTHPVLCCLAYECALVAASARVTLDGMTARADKVVQAGELDDQTVPIVLVEGALLEVFLNERGFQRAVSLFLDPAMG